MAAAAAAEAESGFDPWAGKSPRWWTGEGKRAGACVRGKAFAVRLRDAVDDGDDATLLALLALPIEALSRGRRSKFMGMVYRDCPSHVLAAIATHPELPVWAGGTVGGELAFWSALLELQDLELVKALVEGGAVDVARTRLNEWNSVLHEALMGVDDGSPLVAYLVGLGVVDLDEEGFDGRTLFYRALLGHRLATARVLLAAGCSRELLPGDPYLGHPIARWIDGSPGIVSVLRDEMGVDLAAVGSVHRGTTVLQRLVEFELLEGLEALLEAEIPLREGDMEAAAVEACYSGQEAMALRLLDEVEGGVNATRQIPGLRPNVRLFTPFQAAVHGRHYGLARVLLERGADPLRLPPGMNASHLLLSVAKDGHLGGLRFLVGEAGVTDLDAGNESSEYGSEKPACERDRLTALALVIMTLRPRLLQSATFLLSRGANPDFPCSGCSSESDPNIEEAVGRVKEMRRLRWLIRARSCHDTTRALTAQFGSLAFQLTDPNGFARACTAAATATRAGNLVVGRRLVEGRALPAVRMVRIKDRKGGASFEEERLQAVLGFVLHGDLLPDLYEELMDLLWPAWWWDLEGEDDDDDDDGARLNDEDGDAGAGELGDGDGEAGEEEEEQPAA